MPPGRLRRLQNEILDFWHLIWTKIILALLIGSALTVYSPEQGFFKIARDIGSGLIVAAIITLFWQLPEIREFFLSLSRSVLVQDDYLKKLSLPSLRQLRMAAASVILSKHVDNPDYEWEELESWVDDFLFEKNLPSEQPASGIYRKNYRDIITLEFISSEAALTENKVPTDDVAQAALATEVLKQTTITRYTVVAPRRDARDYKEHSVSLSGRLADMVGFPFTNRVRFYAGRSEIEAEEIHVTTSDHPEGGVEFSASHTVPFVNGEATVWSKVIEYKAPEREPFLVETMSHLTRGLHAQVTAVRTSKPLLFDGNVLAIGGAESIDHPPNGIVLEYTDWLFEDHGYFVYWWENTP